MGKRPEDTHTNYAPLTGVSNGCVKHCLTVFSLLCQYIGKVTTQGTRV